MRIDSFFSGFEKTLQLQWFSLYSFLNIIRFTFSLIFFSLSLQNLSVDYIYVWLSYSREREAWGEGCVECCCPGQNVLGFFLVDYIL